MSRTQWIDYKGKQILYVDYRGLKTPEELIETLDESIREEVASLTKVLVLANFEGSLGSTKYMQHLEKVGTEIGMPKVQKTAVVGLTRVKKIFLKAYIRFSGDNNIRDFGTEAEALDWLVE
jgi:hypothetical protein